MNVWIVFVPESTEPIRGVFNEKENAVKMVENIFKKEYSMYKIKDVFEDKKSYEITTYDVWGTPVSICAESFKIR